MPRNRMQPVEVANKPVQVLPENSYSVLTQLPADRNFKARLAEQKVKILIR